MNSPKMIGLIVVVLLLISAGTYWHFTGGDHRSLETVQEFCSTFNVGDRFVENDFEIRARSKGLQPSRLKIPAVDANGTPAASASDGLFTASKTLAANTSVACHIAAVDGRVESARVDGAHP